MTAITIERFGGIAPRYDAFALPPFGAQTAQDTRLHGGVLRGFRRAASLDPAVAVDAATKTLFYDPGAAKWYSWTSIVDCVLGPVADASAARRYYYTGDGLPKKTDSTLGNTGGSGAYPRTWRYLKVPAPASAPTVSQAGGGGAAENHVYVITYVSTFSGISEESAPSAPVTMAARLVGPISTVTLTWTDTPPTTGYNITARRIYRSNGGDYQFVAEVAVGGASTTEAVVNASLGEAISTTDFDTPPDNLSCLVSMPNGILAGISGNELCFSEPYQPHAWPAKYRIPVADMPTALFVVGQGLYVATEGRPAVCTGIHPDSMTLEYAPIYAPCLSRRSLASDGRGVMYASYNGVAYVNGTDVSVMSEPMMTQYEWESFNPASMIGQFYDGRYLLWYSVSSTNQGALTFDRTVQDAPLTLSGDYTDASHIIAATGKLYVVESGDVREVDADFVNPRTPYVWKSKKFLTPRALNFGYGQVITDRTLSDAAEAYLAKLAYNTALLAAGGGLASWNTVPVNVYAVNGSALLTGIIAEDEYVTFNVYADGNLVLSKTITDDKPFRMPTGFKATLWEIEVTGTLPVRRMTLATSMAEINGQ